MCLRPSISPDGSGRTEIACPRRTKEMREVNSCLPSMKPRSHPNVKPARRPSDEFFDFTIAGTIPLCNFLLIYKCDMRGSIWTGDPPKDVSPKASGPLIPLFSPTDPFPQPVANGRRFDCNVLVKRLHGTGSDLR